MTGEAALLTAVCVAYAGAVVLYVAALLYDQARWERWALLAVAIGFGLHTLALGVGAATRGHPPFRSFLESLSLYAWAVIAIYLVIQWRKPQRVAGALVVPLALAGVAVSAFAPEQTRPAVLEGEGLRLSIHGASAFLAYAFFTLAFGAAVLHLTQRALLKAKRFGTLHQALPSLSLTDRLCHLLAGLGLVSMTACLISGALWAERAWGSPLPWDTKLGLALATWLVYLAWFYARNVAHWRGARSSWMVVTGFVFVLATYLGGQAAGGLHTF